MKLIIHSSSVRPDERANARNVRISKSFTVVIRPLSTCLRKPNFHVLIFETVSLFVCLFFFFIWRYKIFALPPPPYQDATCQDWSGPSSRTNYRGASFKRAKFSRELFRWYTFQRPPWCAPTSFHGNFMEHFWSADIHQPWTDIRWLFAHKENKKSRS